MNNEQEDMWGTLKDPWYKVTKAVNELESNNSIGLEHLHKVALVMNANNYPYIKCKVELSDKQLTGMVKSGMITSKQYNKLQQVGRGNLISVLGIIITLRK